MSEHFFDLIKNFDYGGFRELDEIVGLQEGISELFVFTFNDPGIDKAHHQY